MQDGIWVLVVVIITNESSAKGQTGAAEEAAGDEPVAARYLYYLGISKA
jgi:hypothetical protein